MTPTPVSHPPPAKTSIIVLTYRRIPALLAVLKSLAQQCDNSCEVVIADDGSPCDDQDVLRQNLPRFACPVSHVWHPDMGFTASRARNLGVRVSVGERLVFLDGDCIPNAQFLDQHVALSRRGEFVNGSRILLGERLTAQIEKGAVDIVGATIAQWLRWRWHGDVNKLLPLRFWPAGSPFRRKAEFHWKGIRSCNLAVWRDDFFAINGFDESFEGWGHEDADLVLRLHHHGVRRCNGFLATEVFHLWHPENSRTRASKNHQTVIDRKQTGQLRALQGLQEAVGLDEMVVTVLN